MQLSGDDGGWLRWKTKHGLKTIFNEGGNIVLLLKMASECVVGALRSRLVLTAGIPAPQILQFSFTLVHAAYPAGAPL